MSMSSGRRRQRRRVMWDEENLNFLEVNKTPKQKINEPKTPYHTLSLDPDEAAALSPIFPNGGSDTEDSAAQRERGEREGGAFGNEVNVEAIRSALTEIASSSGGRGDSGLEGGRGGRLGSSSRLSEWTSSEGEDETENSAEFERWLAAEGKSLSIETDGSDGLSHGADSYYGKKGKWTVDNFKEHRRTHYDEFRKLKQFKAQGKDPMVEEEEDPESQELKQEMARIASKDSDPSAGDKEGGLGEKTSSKRQSRNRVKFEEG